MFVWIPQVVGRDVAVEATHVTRIEIFQGASVQCRVQLSNGDWIDSTDDARELAQRIESAKLPTRG